MLRGKAQAANSLKGIHEVIASFIIAGAWLMGHDGRLGSIEAGKLTDLAVLSQDVVELAQRNRANGIGGTLVDMAVFDGRVVYERR